jgi:hypothetical protein
MGALPFWFLFSQPMNLYDLVHWPLLGPLGVVFPGWEGFLRFLPVPASELGFPERPRAASCRCAACSGSSCLKCFACSGGPLRFRAIHLPRGPGFLKPSSRLGFLKAHGPLRLAGRACPLFAALPVLLRQRMFPPHPIGRQYGVRKICIFSQ